MYEVEAAGWQVEMVEEATHHAFPFIHFIVYGIGKLLIENGLFPNKWRKNSDRLNGENNDGKLLDPGNLMRRAFRAVDLRNDLIDNKDMPDTFVNVLVKATRSNLR